MMYTILMVIHIIISAGLVLVILVQTSKGAGLDGTLGGTATNILGGQAAPAFLKKATVTFAILFVISCFLLAFYLKGDKVFKATAVQKMKKELVNEKTTEPEVEIPVETEVPDQVPAAAEESSTSDTL